MQSSAIIKTRLGNELGPLYDLFCRLIKQSPMKPDLKSGFIEQCQDLVTTLKASKKPVKILLSTYNVPDGIGDAMNLIGIYLMLKRLFANFHHVEIKAVAYINNERLPNFKAALPGDELDANEIAYFDSRQPNIKSAITIFSSPGSKTLFALYNTIKAEAPHLKLFCESCDLFINVATPMGPVTHPFALLKKECIIHSILEIGHEINEAFKNAASVRALRQYPEMRMGMLRQDAGFKLDTKLLALTEEAGKAQRAREKLKATKLGALIFPGKTACRLAIGYLQSEPVTHMATEVFIRTGDQQKNVVLVCNSDFVKSYLQMKPGVKKQFTEITFCSCDGEIQQKIAENNKTARTLVVVDFRGIIEETKLTLSASADWVMGSGDTSRTDTMLCRLPFWQILPWKTKDMADFAASISEKYPAVSTYLLLLIEASAWDYLFLEQAMMDELVMFLNKYESQLVNEWHALRAVIIGKHNIETYFSSILLVTLQAIVGIPNSRPGLQKFCNALVKHYDALEKTAYEPHPNTNSLVESFIARIKKHHKILCNMLASDAATRGLEQVLFKIYPYFNLNNLFLQTCNDGQPLLVTAVEKNAIQCLAYLLKTQPQLDVNKNDPTQQGATALHRAIQKGHIDCARLLLSAPTMALDTLDNHGKKAEDYCKAKDKILFKKDANSTIINLTNK